MPRWDRRKDIAVVFAEFNNVIRDGTRLDTDDGDVPAVDRSISMADMRLSFSVLMTMVLRRTGIAPPVSPVPPPLGITLRPSFLAARMSPGTSSTASGYTTTVGYSTRQSVASVAWATLWKAVNWILPFAVYDVRT